MQPRSEKAMHRLKNNANDWDGIPDGELTLAQRVAKKTHGVATFANGITTAGFVIFMNGLNEFANGNKAAGLAEMAVGSSADFVDGYEAEKHHVKGKFGRALDPTVDIVEIAVALPVLERVGALPLLPVVAVAAPKVVGAIASINAFRRGIEVNPTDEGKNSAIAIRGGVCAFLIKAAADHHAPGFVDVALDVVGWGGMAAGAALSMPAARDYASAGFGPRPMPAPHEQ